MNINKDNVIHRLRLMIKETIIEENNRNPFDDEVNGFADELFDKVVDELKVSVYEDNDLDEELFFEFAAGMVGEFLAIKDNHDNFGW